VRARQRRTCGRGILDGVSLAVHGEGPCSCTCKGIAEAALDKGAHCASHARLGSILLLVRSAALMGLREGSSPGTAIALQSLPVMGVVWLH